MNRPALERSDAGAFLRVRGGDREFLFRQTDVLAVALIPPAEREHWALAGAPAIRFAAARCPLFALNERFDLGTDVDRQASLALVFAAPSGAFALAARRVRFHRLDPGTRFSEAPRHALAAIAPLTATIGTQSLHMIDGLALIERFEYHAMRGSVQ